MGRYLTMLEVSQKQAYIFESNKLKDNIVNSAVIAWIMSPEYFEKILDDETVFNKKDNLVYSGGGHIVLEFPDREKAEEFVKKITFQIKMDYPGIEVFAVVRKYDTEGGKGPGENLKELTGQLEVKKSRRLSAFHQGSFGIEEIDRNTLKPIMKVKGTTGRNEMPEQEERIDIELAPQGYKRVEKFSELGGTRDESNFIAVVHIDGNAMGKRVEKLYEKNKTLSWDEYKRKLQAFSRAIDKDFKDTYKEMTEEVRIRLEKGELDDLCLKEKHFPIRRIITAGDDICFVTEGRIGIECAVAFIKALNKKVNSEDKEKYAACGGVAIVHQKYPFYKAYELSELLCSNAKKFGASLSADGTGSDISAIDWHIEFGEIKDSLEEIRKAYITLDQKRMELRPYMISAAPEIWKKEPVRRYDNFKKLITAMKKKNIAYARGKMKELRAAIKRGSESAEFFMRFNKIEDIALESYQGIFESVKTDRIGSGQGLDRKVFVKTSDGRERALVFDALEILDTYIGFEEGEQ